MKQILISAVVAAAITLLVLQIGDAVDDGAAPNGDALDGAPPAEAEMPGQAHGLTLTYTEALPEDVWVDGSRATGDDHRSLTNAENSICFITKVEIRGIRAPEDANSCVMQIDEFTGFWDLAATVEEGGQSQVRCNARCLVWE